MTLKKVLKNLRLSSVNLKYIANLILKVMRNSESLGKKKKKSDFLAQTSYFTQLPHVMSGLESNMAFMYQEP